MNSHKTAITRKKLSVPMRHLVANGYIPWIGSVLDYGCGKGSDADILNEDGHEFKKYDPHYFPKMPGKTFPVVTCHYVLNVVKQPGKVIGQAWERVRGKGYLAVSVRSRSDIASAAKQSNWAKSGAGYVTGRGTYQRGFTMRQLVKLARNLGRVKTIEEIRIPKSSGIMVIIHKA